MRGPVSTPLFPNACLQSPRSFSQATFHFGPGNCLGLLRNFLDTSKDHKQVEFLVKLVSWQLTMWVPRMKYNFFAMTQ